MSGKFVVVVVIRSRNYSLLEQIIIPLQECVFQEFSNLLCNFLSSFRIWFPLVYELFIDVDLV